MGRTDSLEKMLGKIEGGRRRTTEDEMVGWYHWLDGHEFEQALRVGDGQGSLACCSPWGHKESDTTETLNWLTVLFYFILCLFWIFVAVYKLSLVAESGGYSLVAAHGLLIGEVSLVAERKWLSCVQLFAIPWAIQSMEFSRPEHWVVCVAFSFSTGSSQPRDQTQFSHITGGFFTSWATQGSPRILEWVAYPFSSRSSWSRNQTRFSCIAGGFFTNWATGEVHVAEYRL